MGFIRGRGEIEGEAGVLIQGHSIVIKELIKVAYSATTVKGLAILRQNACSKTRDLKGN